MARSQRGGDTSCRPKLAGLMCALVAFETMRSREFRGELRAQ
jgi:hypothetical protein